MVGTIGLVVDSVYTAMPVLVEANATVINFRFDQVSMQINTMTKPRRAIHTYNNEIDFNFDHSNAVVNCMCKCANHRYTTSSQLIDYVPRV